MATKKKMLQAAAGSAGGGAGLNVEDVFSTYLYEGNGSTQTITNGIDLDGEGGLVWIKNRGSGNATWHYLFDTERNGGLYSNSTSAEFPATGFLNSFNSDGFTLGGTVLLTQASNNFASWTFRKAPKFFDVVTYTGDGNTTKTISHNLGSEPGCIIVKRTDDVGQWAVYHRSTTNPVRYYAWLNATNSFADAGADVWGASSIDFTIHSGLTINASGGTYVAYLFAHNDGDGEFGPTGDQDIIKCGSYTGDGTTDGSNEINVGFEPQFVIIKVASGAASNWGIYDNMRGIVSDGNDGVLLADLSNSEFTTLNPIELTPTGFKLTRATNFENGSGNTYIYIAIRRGPMGIPESASEVFAAQATRDATDGTSATNAFTSGFPLDFIIQGGRAGGGHLAVDRVRGNNYLQPNDPAAEASWVARFDSMDGFPFTVSQSANSNFCAWMWRRAPNFFDVVAYTGDGVAGRTVPHGLTVPPEMMWVKRRDSTAGWMVYHKDLGNTKYLQLEDTYAAGTLSTAWNNTSPTDTNFTLGSFIWVNYSGYEYIAYLFASLDGVSKVGSYTGNGSTQNIDCGFSSGARFVLLKNASSIDSWRVFDSERGIISGNDPMLYLDSTEAEETGGDYIDPYSGGFALTSNSSVNANGDTYIFYAIA